MRLKNFSPSVAVALLPCREMRMPFHRASLNRAFSYGETWYVRGACVPLVLVEAPLEKASRFLSRLSSLLFIFHLENSFVDLIAGVGTTHIYIYWKFITLLFIIVSCWHIYCLCNKAIAKPLRGFFRRLMIHYRSPMWVEVRWHPGKRNP